MWPKDIGDHFLNFGGTTMGYWKEKMMEDEDRGVDFVRDLISREMLEGSALGVAKLWLDTGDDGLSDKQKYVLDEYVFKPYVREGCSRCAQAIPWSEMLEAYDNGGMCGYCAHMMSKDE